MPIKDLEQILSNRIEKGKKLIDTSSTALVAPGENYGGELLGLEITVEDENTKARDIIHAVGKKIPPTKQLQESFNIQVTFRAEILFYEKIVPMLREFQKENGIKDVINCFVEFYGGRLNLNGSAVVDKDAVIIMENLITSGYKNIDRHIGYNLEESRIVIKDLANLQATVLALKLKKPDVFQKEIRPLCCNVLTPPGESQFSEVINVIRDILLENDKIAAYVPKAMVIWSKYENKIYKAREPFATLSHCDLWVNNAMMKYENGKPIKNIFIDFQLYSYKSPVIDLLNFLFTSVQTEILQKEFDNLIKFYHSELILNLHKLNCDSEPFSFSKFEEELEIDAGFVLSWTLIFISLVVFGEKRKPDQEVKGSDMDFKSEEFLNKVRSMMPQGKERLYFMIETFGRKGWLRTE